MAGIIGAIGNNGLGVTGVNWNVKIMPVQVFNAGQLTEADIISGYNYVLQNRILYNQTNGDRGAFIVSTCAAFAKSGWHPNDHADWCAVFDELGSAGILNVGGVQNHSVEIDAQGGFPAPPTNFSMPAMCGSNFLITPTNSTHSDVLAWNAPWSIPHIDIAAPGTGIFSTISGGFGFDSGTSMAAPLIAGTVALIHSAACEEFAYKYDASPAYTTLEIRKAILNNSDYVAGLIPLIGGGRLNVFKSVRAFLKESVSELDVNGVGGNPLVESAINHVLVQEYTSVYSMLIQAGSSIQISANTTLEPSSASSQLFEISPGMLACAVPYEPISLDLYAPSVAYCSTPMGVPCNAIVSGGVAPFSYVWKSRLLTSSTWHTHSSSVATCIMFWSGNFVVEVTVTDAIGNTATAGPAVIMCLHGIEYGQDGLIDQIEERGDLSGPPIGMPSEDTGQGNPEVALWPNPSNGTVNIWLAPYGSLDETVVWVIDITGRIVPGSHRRLVIGGVNELVLDVAAGSYFVIMDYGDAVMARRISIAR